MENLTWPEAADAIGKHPVVLLPLGARTKEHGPHLPLNNDWLLAEGLAHRVAERCAVLVLPTLPYGFYPAFVEYPGSVSIGRDTCRDLIVDICRSYARHGASRFYVLNTGLSTLRSLEPASEILQREGIALRYTRLDQAWATVIDQVATQPEGTHADEIETSIMLHIAPHVVRMERAVCDIHPRLSPGPLTRDPAARAGRYSPSGSYGDPTRASADKGRRLVDAMIEHIVAEIEALAATA